MCSLFGFYNYSNKDIKGISELTNKLAREATIRGTDACIRNRITNTKVEKTHIDQFNSN